MHAVNAHHTSELYKRFKTTSSVVHRDGETTLQRASATHAGKLRRLGGRDGFCRVFFLIQTVLRTPRGPPRQKLPDAPENQQRQLREVRDETAPPRLAVRF